jgi:hypothetical protein
MEETPLMSNVKLMVVEDDQVGMNLLDDHFSPEGFNEELPSFQLDRELSERVGGLDPDAKLAIFEDKLEKIKLVMGPMVLMVDFDLQLQGDEREKVRVEIEQIIGKTITGDLYRHFDGLRVAVEAIRQREIKPLLVFLQSGYGQFPTITALLEEFIQKQGREKEVKVVSAEEGKHLGYPGITKEIVGKILKDAAQKYRSKFVEPRLDSLFQMLGDAHSEINDDHQAAATKLLTGFLGLSENEFDKKIWDVWKGQQQESIQNTLKRLGIPGRNELPASSAWFYVLGAYLHSNNTRPWHEIFDVKNLLEEGLELCYLTPPQKSDTLKKTIRCFYEMCAALFRREPQQEKADDTCPLRSVTLSRQGGLRILLNYDCGVRVEGKDASLYEQIGNWRSSSLEWSDKSDNPNARNTSKAIWRFWQATSLGDLNLDEDTTDNAGVFGNITFWRMNIYRKPLGLSEVVFKAERGSYEG